jgi:hypothetical protein
MVVFLVAISCSRIAAPSVSAGVIIVLAIKNDIIRLFADLAEMSKTSCFAKRSYFGAIGRLGGADHFFSPAQYCAGNKK